MQVIGVLIPLAGCIAMLRNRFESKSAVRLLMANFGCMIMNAGCLLVVIAGNSSEAISAFKTEYLGNALFYYFFIMFVAEYLQIRLPRLFAPVWAGLECLIVAVVWQDTLREKLLGNIWFDNSSSWNILAAVVPQSTLYLVRYSCLCLMLVIGLVYSTVRVLKTDLPAERYNLARITGAQFVVALSLMIQLLAKPKIEIVPIFAALSLLAVVISIHTDGFFGITDSGHEWVFQQMEDAYILTDSLRGFLDANPAALRLFPELENRKRGAELPEHINAMLDEEEKSESETPASQCVVHNGRFYEKKVTKLEKNGKLIGYALLLDDDTEQQRYSNLLSRYNNELQNEVSEKTQHIQDVLNSIITGMASVIESRDNSTGGHVRRTSRVVKVYAKRLLQNAEELGVDEAFIHHVIKAAPMHDVGKIAVKDAVLQKPGKFTDVEFEEMKRHPAAGAALLEEILCETDDEELARIAINVAHYHHERWDGSGYPDGLSGEDIPLEARIMALADVFDALVSPRCYKDPMSFDKAFEIIAKGLGKHFDPVLGAIFLQCRPELEALYISMWGGQPPQARPDPEPGLAGSSG